MSGLAEDDLEAPSLGRRLVLIAAVVLSLLAVGSAAWWLKSQLSQPSEARRQVARISILPDTPPPPPPPPPKEQPKPPPRDDNKPPPPDLAPKPQQAPAPANEPIKMEGAAGSGDSPFAAGTVKNDYQGGAPTIGGAGGKAPVAAADRAQQRLYANNARQLLRDEIEKHLRADTQELAAEFTLWLAPDGSIQRFEPVPSGDPQRDAAISAALEQTRRQLRLPPPPVALLPMRFKLTVRPQG
jgi:periplasmic protein TonB